MAKIEALKIDYPLIPHTTLVDWLLGIVGIRNLPSRTSEVSGCPDDRLQVRGCAVSRNMLTTVIVVVVLIVLVIVLLQFLR